MGNALALSTNPPAGPAERFKRPSEQRCSASSVPCRIVAGQAARPIEDRQSAVWIFVHPHRRLDVVMAMPLRPGVSSAR